LKKEHFVGLRELRKESERGASRQVVGLEIDLGDYEHLYQQVDCRRRFPSQLGVVQCLYTKETRQVGHATTGAWSPILKKYIALATVGKEYVEPGTRVDF